MEEGAFPLIISYYTKDRSQLAVQPHPPQETAAGTPVCVFKAALLPGLSLLIPQLPMTPAALRFLVPTFQAWGPFLGTPLSGFVPDVSAPPHLPLISFASSPCPQPQRVAA